MSVLQTEMIVVSSGRSAEGRRDALGWDRERNAARHACPCKQSPTPIGSEAMSEIDPQFTLSADKLRSVALRFGAANIGNYEEWINYVSFEHRDDLLLVEVVYRSDRPVGVPPRRIWSRENGSGYWKLEQEGPLSAAQHD